MQKKITIILFALISTLLISCDLEGPGGSTIAYPAADQCEYVLCDYRGQQIPSYQGHYDPIEDRCFYRGHYGKQFYLCQRGW